MPTRVAIVPHTHWDREWHTPADALQVRLASLLDGLLTLMEDEPSFAHTPAGAIPRAATEDPPTEPR